MTTIRQLIAQIDKTIPYYGWTEKGDFSTALGLNCYGYDEVFTKSVKVYWLNSWICTDTQVGTAAYFLHDELVAVSHQQARKSGKDIRFVSCEAAIKMKEFILSLEEISAAHLCNLDQEIECTEEAGYRMSLEGAK